MASVLQSIVEAQSLPTTAALLYTSPTGTYTQIVKLTCTNTGGSSYAVTFYVVPAGGSPGSSNCTTYQQAIAASATWNSPNEYGLVLNPGDMLYGLVSAGTVNVAVAGLLVS